MADTSTQCGLYVVGWFSSGSWDTSDTRKAKAARRDIPTLKTELSQAATSVLSSRRVVKAILLDVALH
jgi:hypothetical protein